MTAHAQTAEAINHHRRQTAKMKDRDKEQTISAIAKRCFTECDGDLAEATAAMQAMVVNDIALYTELMGPLVKEACYRIISSMRRSERHRIWTAPEYAPSNTGKDVVALARANSSLFDFCLPSGIRLRDATKADLLDASSFYHAQGRDMLHKARWLRAIAAKVRGRKTAAQALKEPELERLRDETRTTVDADVGE